MAHVKIKKLYERLLIIGIHVFLFCIPIQTIWIYKQPIVDGVLWQYGTLGIYGLQVYAWMLIVLCCYVKRKYFLQKIQNISYSQKKIGAIGLCLCIILLYGVNHALYSVVSIQHFCRLLTAFAMIPVIIATPSSSSQKMLWFVLGAMIQSVIGTVQIVTQQVVSSSVFGISEQYAYVQGVSVVASDTIGRWLRAYGTFPHPNIYGGYLAICTILIWANYLFVQKEKKYTALTIVASSVCLWGIWCSLSRSALVTIGIAGVCACVYNWYIFKKIPIWLISTIMVPSIIALIAFWSIISVRVYANAPHEQQSIEERYTQYSVWKHVVAQHPWRGTGIGSYTTVLHELNIPVHAWERQPIHNIPLLIIAEWGYIATAIGAYGLYAIQRISIKHRQWLIVGSVLIIPLLITDHYLYTTMSGIWLVTVYASLSYSCFFHKSST